jgi:hypothetical protein
MEPKRVVHFVITLPSMDQNLMSTVERERGVESLGKDKED